MHTFWDREKEEVRQFLADYQRVCDYLATVTMDDDEWINELERASEVAPPWDEAGEEKMLE